MGSRSTKLGSLCEDLEALPKRTAPMLTFSFEDLVASAKKSSCRLCCIIHDALEAWPVQHYSRFADVDVVRHKSGLVVEHGARHFEICTFKKDRIPDTIPLVNPVSANTGSDEGLKIAKSWLVDCINNHGDICRQPVPGVAAHRILDIGTDDPNSRIVLQEVSDSNRLYACLSHCWGQEKSLRTTIHNIEDHKRNIPWDALPKTFQDAISFTRRLGIRHLWIDSLCIIQDEEDLVDWRYQSTIMGDIYRNAMVTLAASASHNSSEGLFRPARSRKTSFLLSTTHNRPEYDNIVVRDRIRMGHSKFEHPLLDRAWVLQERLLSPRVLHFGRYEMIWECMGATTCECQMLKIGNSGWLQAKQLYQNVVLALCDASTVANAWHLLVSDYSQMRLSYETDIFPAISGAVKIVEQAMEKDSKTRYIAGLWEHTIMEDLLWRSRYPQQLRRPKTWRAPTFSWASVSNRIASGAHDGIEYSKHRILSSQLQTNQKGEEQQDLVEGYATMLSAAVTPAGLDHRGQLTAAHIILRGTLIAGKLVDGRESEVWDIAIPGEASNLKPSRFEADYDLAARDGHQVELDALVSCLKVRYLFAFQLKMHYLYFLVLRQVGDAWERIGLLCYQQRQDLVPPPPPVEDWFKDAEVTEDAVVKIV